MLTYFIFMCWKKNCAIRVSYLFHM